MATLDSSEIYYPLSWMKTTVGLLYKLLFTSPQKSKRSLPEEAECGSLEGIRCWLREGESLDRRANESTPLCASTQVLTSMRPTPTVTRR
jgi:hypothetical protein